MVVAVPGAVRVGDDRFHPDAVAGVRRERHGFAALQPIDRRARGLNGDAAPGCHHEQAGLAVDEVPHERVARIDFAGKANEGSRDEARRGCARALGLDKRQREADRKRGRGERASHAAIIARRACRSPSPELFLDAPDGVVGGHVRLQAASPTCSRPSRPRNPTCRRPGDTRRAPLRSSSTRCRADPCGRRSASRGSASPATVTRRPFGVPVRHVDVEQRARREALRRAPFAPRWPPLPPRDRSRTWPSASARRRCSARPAARPRARRRRCRNT